MPQFSVNAQRFDPYKNFKFRVKWEGQYVAGVSKVGGLRQIGPCTIAFIAVEVGIAQALQRGEPLPPRLGGRVGGDAARVVLARARPDLRQGVTIPRRSVLS